MIYHHVSVLKKEVIEYLNPLPNQNFIDCTLGGGGHTLEILKRVGPRGKVLGIDLDGEAIDSVKGKLNSLQRNFNNQLFPHQTPQPPLSGGLRESSPYQGGKNGDLILVQGNFKDLVRIYEKHFSGLFVHGILLDLGVSSPQFDDPKRGFSFKGDGLLDMNFDQSAKFKASEIVNNWSQKKLEAIFKDYGEEVFSRQIARGIILARAEERIETTRKLAEIVQNSIPKRFHFKKTHPATRVFQALRVAVNDELENLRNVLPQIERILVGGGRIAVISFHSLEDRIVKKIFAKESRSCICPPSFPICKCSGYPKFKILTKKPVVASEEEVKSNPRSRSAKLRVAEMVLQRNKDTRYKDTNKKQFDY